MMDTHIKSNPFPDVETNQSIKYNYSVTNKIKFLTRCLILNHLTH